MGRDCEFITMVNTGEKPDAEVHAAIFDSEDSVNTINSVTGHGRHLALGLSKLVGNFCKTLREQDSDDACAAFMMLIMESLAENTNEKIARKAQAMAAAKQLAGMLNSDDFKDMLKDLVSEDFEEEGAEE